MVYRSNCGVYVIKYIELLAVGSKDLTIVNDDYVLAFREKANCLSFMFWPINLIQIVSMVSLFQFY